MSVCRSLSLSLIFTKYAKNYVAIDSYFEELLGLQFPDSINDERKSEADSQIVQASRISLKEISL